MLACSNQRELRAQVAINRDTLLIQTDEQTESSMWSNRQIIETQSVDTLVTTSCLTPLPLSSPPVGNILHLVVKGICLILKSDVLIPLTSLTMSFFDIFLFRSVDVDLGMDLMSFFST